jgi:hypothetical protein
VYFNDETFFKPKLNNDMNKKKKMIKCIVTLGFFVVVVFSYFLFHYIFFLLKSFNLKCDFCTKNYNCLLN